MSNIRRSMMAASRHKGGGGGLPAGYTEVVAIANQGAAYINTGWVPKVAPRLVTDIMVTGGSDQDIVGMDATAPTWSADVYMGGNGTCYYRYGSTSYVSFTTNMNDKTIYYHLDIGQDYIVDGVIKRTMTAYDFSPNTKECKLFAGRTGRTQACTMKRTQLYDGDTLVRDFIPCISPNNVVGMYDLITGAFYSSATSTQFIVQL